MGAALVAPRLALAAAVRGDAAGRTGSDAAALIALGFLAANLVQIVVAGWLMVEVGGRAGLNVLGAALSRAVVFDMIVLFGAAATLTVAAGRARAPGRDFDLACVAFVPYLAVALVVNLGLRVAGVVPGVALVWSVRALALGWAAWVLFLAWRQVREGAPASEGEVRPGAVRGASAALLGVVAALVVVNGSWVLANVDAVRPIRPGDVAPAFALPEVDREGHLTGETRALSELRGKVVLVDFWAEWCGPCRTSLPTIDRLHRRFRDRGFEVLSVKTDGPDMGRASKAIAVTAFPMVVDEGEVADAYRVTTLPHLVLIDHLGVVRSVHHGIADAGELAAAIESLLARVR